jgi:hypothetical protein
MGCENLASDGRRTHTSSMSMTSARRVASALILLGGTLWCARIAGADEIRLKDGKKLYGVIVGYDDNMFKVKTDFGYVLVEKDKIASIVPDAAEQPATAKTQPASDSAVTNEAKTTEVTNEEVKKQKAAAILANANTRPAVPTASNTATDTKAPAIKTAVAAPKTALIAPTAAPAPPKEEPAPLREEVQGNLYINHEFNFRMYKAPSWQIIDGAGQTLPNAIVAMGTANESTLLVVGHEQSKDSLEKIAQITEQRLHDAYDNYRLVSQRKAIVGGQPAVEYRYQGKADDHDWSGTLSIVAHGGEYLTVLGMTYADSDLIQIQENVIARAIDSLQFGH